MSRHRPGARASQCSAVQILRREGRPELPSSPSPSTAMIVSGVVGCISAGLLAVLVTVQRPAVPAPVPSPTRPAATHSVATHSAATHRVSAATQSATLPVGLPSTPATTLRWTTHVPPALPETVAVPEPPAAEPGAG